jgi:phenylpropionate dioxygenase-like ring-hydroxylating dioxygenase large terminal subunit
MGLKPVRVGEWGGLVWICLDPDTEDLREYLAPLPEHLACYPLERYALTIDQSVEWECNWKVAVDAFHETYHNLGTHPQIMGYAGDVNVQIDCYDRHTRFLLPNGAPAPSIRKRERPTAAQIALFARDDFDASDFDGTADEVLPVFQEHKRERMLAQGFEVEDLSLEQFTDNYHYTVFPNTQISVRASDSLVTRSRPHPSDPERMVFDLQTFVHIAPLAERPSRPETERGAGVDFPFRPDFVVQDALNMPLIQRGFHSAGYEGSELSDLELRIRHWHAVYDAHLGGRTRLDLGTGSLL